MIQLSDLIEALVRQGVSVKKDGVIIWSLCKYCNRSGWVSEDITNRGGCKLVHEPGCFIELATKWLDTDNQTLVGLSEII
jgi:hypothetical protein